MDEHQTKVGWTSEGKWKNVEWKLNENQTKKIEWQNGKIIELWNGKTAQLRKRGTTKPHNHGMAERNETGLDYN